MANFLNSLSPTARMAATTEALAILQKKYPSLSTEMSIDEADFTTYGAAEPGPNDISPDMQDYLASRKKK